MAAIAQGRAVAEGYSELPFAPNPQAFADYINRTWEWTDGKKRVFSNLGGCREWGHVANAINGRDYYICAYGYMTITDIMHGTRFCELSAKSPIVDGVYRDIEAAIYFMQNSSYKQALVEHAPASYCRRP